MNKLLSWAKSNLLIVILMVVSVVALPVGWVVSSGMNSGIRKGRLNELQTPKSQLEGVSRVEYSDMDIGLGGATESVSSAPHDMLTQVFSERRNKQKIELQRVVDKVKVIGSEDRDLLIPGLFPKPPADITRLNTLLNQMVKSMEWAGPADRTSAYGGLLALVRAGSPPDGEVVGEMLRDYEESEISRIEQSGSEVTVEQDEEIGKKLIAVRLGQYKLRADEISVYMVPDAFVYSASTSVPPFTPNTYGRIPRYEECFVWQYDYWILRDILKAVADANARSDGSPTSVADSSVKRILKIQQYMTDIMKRVESKEQKTAEGGLYDDSVLTFSLESERLAPVYINSVSGREVANGLYETRVVEMQVIVAFDKLPRLYDAIASNGIMSVVGLQMSAAKVEQDLKQGYYYGEEYVVEATLTIEVVYQRSWFAQYIPDSIRSVIGIPVEVEDIVDPEDPGE